MVELARAAGLGRLGHVAIDSTRVAANASPNRVETKERLRAERARIRRRIRRWQQACNADDPNEASGLELKKEEMTRLQERLAEIPSRLEQLKRARSDTFPGPTPTAVFCATAEASLWDTRWMSPSARII